jgi:hypothetical protein
MKRTCLVGFVGLVMMLSVFHLDNAGATPMGYSVTGYADWVYIDNYGIYGSGGGEVSGNLIIENEPYQMSIPDTYDGTLQYNYTTTLNLENFTTLTADGIFKVWDFARFTEVEVLGDNTLFFGNAHATFFHEEGIPYTSSTGLDAFNEYLTLPQSADIYYIWFQHYVSLYSPETISQWKLIGGNLHLEQNPVPEPATILLMVTGLAGLAATRKKKKGASPIL